VARSQGKTVLQMQTLYVIFSGVRRAIRNLPALTSLHYCCTDLSVHQESCLPSMIVATQSNLICQSCSIMRMEILAKGELGCPSHVLLMLCCDPISSDPLEFLSLIPVA
jgi:hypothetical protein